MSVHQFTRTFLCAAMAMLLQASMAAGEDTRAGQLAREQAARAATSEYAPPGGTDRLIRTIKRTGIFDTSRGGFHPVVSTVYPGGWVAFGAGYRQPFMDTGMFRVSGEWSVKNFRAAAVSVDLPERGDGRVAFGVESTLIDAPEVVFYGVGDSSRAEDRTHFSYRPVSLDFAAKARPHGYVGLGASVGYLSIETGAPVPVDAAVWTMPLEAGSRPEYVRTQLSAEVDWRMTPGYTGRGGSYRVQAEHLADRSGSKLGYRSLEMEAIQLLPILRARWVIAIRALATITDGNAGGDVPFFVMPSIGGNNSVRGYSSLRFRDRHRVLVNAEYRWTAAKFMDMALFYDAGKVTHRTRDLDLRDLRTSYGVGARFHSRQRTVFRLELARNGEGDLRLIWSTRAAF